MVNNLLALGKFKLKYVFLVVLSVAIAWVAYSLIRVRSLSTLAEERRMQKAAFWANQRMPYINEHLDSLIWNGDTTAYHEMRHLMQDEPTTMQMGYSLIMSVRYEYPAACFDLYADIVSIYNRMGIGLDSIDANSKELALLYLRRAAVKGEVRALKELKRLGLE